MGPYPQQKIQNASVMAAAAADADYYNGLDDDQLSYFNKYEYDVNSNCCKLNTNPITTLNYNIIDIVDQAARPPPPPPDFDAQKALLQNTPKHDAVNNNNNNNNASADAKKKEDENER